jgi:hypothetical protein
MLLLVLATVIAGCGGPSRSAASAHQPVVPSLPTVTQPAAVAAVRAAAQSTTGPMDVRALLVGATALVGGGLGITAVAEGAFDLGNESRSGSLLVGPQAGAGQGRLVASAARLVFEGATLFVHPARTGGLVLPKGSSWVSVPLAGSDVVRENFSRLELTAESLDPAFVLEEVSLGAWAAAPLAGSALAAAEREAPGPLPSGLRWFAVAVSLPSVETGLGGEAPTAAAGPRLASLAQATPGLPAFGKTAAALLEAVHEELLAAEGATGFAPLGTGPGGPLVAVAVALDADGRIAVVELTPPGAGVGFVALRLEPSATAVTVAPPPPGQVVAIARLAPSAENERGGDADGG